VTEVERSGFDGLQVLVVEDEYLLADNLRHDLQNAGCLVVGPFRRLAQARQAANECVFDCAILDINLAGELVYPLADQLTARNTPFLFLTGYSQANMPERFRACPRVPKPYSRTELLQGLRYLQDHCVAS
jgi:DNA-binding response OmpR family regulator